MSIVILAVLGIYLNYSEPNVAKNTILYFTIQSNIWMVGICLVLCLFDWRRRPVPKAIFGIKFIFTVAITLTGVVYNLILAPQYGMLFGSFWRAYSTSIVLLHVVVPALSVFSFLRLDDMVPDKRLRPAGCIMPLLYFACVMLLSLNEHSEGMFEGIGGGSTRFPYFFMDYETNGWFTISANIGELGVFYWITVGLLLILGISTALLWLKKKCS